MSIENQEQSIRDWATTHFAGADLTHIKRVDRVIAIAEAMASNPGKSLPELFAHPYDVKAAYTFLRNAEVTPENLQSGHRDLVMCEMEKPGHYLLLEDTSEITCSDSGEIIGLGPVGKKKNKHKGFHLHSVLALCWPDNPDQAAPRRPGVEILGMADQQYHVRKERPKKKPNDSSLRRKLQAEELESSLWEKGSRRIGSAPDREDVIWTKVGDRGADIYDHLNECQKQRQHFVIRACQNRVLVSSDGERVGKLFETVRSTAGCGEVELELRSRPGQAARQVSLQVSFTPVILLSPQVAGHAPATRGALKCNAVRIWEADPVKGEKPIEWILLTDHQVESFEQACEIIQMYATRWLEEEFHKALKTGMDVEGAQVKTENAWFALTAIKSIVALRLIQMREQTRLAPEAPAESSGLSKIELEVLRARTNRPIKTIKEVSLAIGRLGGHLNRKGDGLPGWITLWRGWNVLQTLVEGVLLARKLTSFG